MVDLLYVDEVTGDFCCSFGKAAHHSQEYFTAVVSSLGDICIVKENSLIFMYCSSYC